MYPNYGLFALCGEFFSVGLSGNLTTKGHKDHKKFQLRVSRLCSFVLSFESKIFGSPDTSPRML